MDLNIEKISTLLSELLKIRALMVVKSKQIANIPPTPAKPDFVEKQKDWEDYEAELQQLAEQKQNLSNEMQQLQKEYNEQQRKVTGAMPSNTWVKVPAEGSYLWLGYQTDSWPSSVPDLEMHQEKPTKILKHRHIEG